MTGRLFPRSQMVEKAEFEKGKLEYRMCQRPRYEKHHRRLSGVRYEKHQDRLRAARGLCEDSGLQKGKQMASL